MQARWPLLLTLLACAPADGDGTPEPAGDTARVVFSLVDGPATSPVPRRSPLASLPEDLLRQRDGWIRLDPQPSREGDAEPPRVSVGLSNTPAPRLHLGWVGGWVGPGDGQGDGRPTWRDVDRELPFLPTALAAHGPGDERFYLAGWEPGQDRVIVQACRLEVGGWLDEAGAPDRDGPAVTRRTVWRSEPGEGALVKALACHPFVGRLVLLSGGACPALSSLDLAGGAPAPLGIDCTDEPFLGRVEALGGGLLAGPPSVAGAFAIQGDEVTRRVHDHALGVACTSDSCRDRDGGCEPLPMLGWLLMLDEGADGRFEQLRSYGDATYGNLGLHWATGEDGQRP